MKGRPDEMKGDKVNSTVCTFQFQPARSRMWWYIHTCSFSLISTKRLFQNIALKYRHSPHLHLGGQRFWQLQNYIIPAALCNPPVKNHYQIPKYWNEFDSVEIESLKSNTVHSFQLMLKGCQKLEMHFTNWKSFKNR